MYLWSAHRNSVKAGPENSHILTIVTVLEVNIKTFSFINCTGLHPSQREGLGAREIGGDDVNCIFLKAIINALPCSGGKKIQISIYLLWNTWDLILFEDLKNLSPNISK